MDTDLERRNSGAGDHNLSPPCLSLSDCCHDYIDDYDDDDSNCSTPYVSAPSSPSCRSFPPGVGNGYYYSAPTSPMQYVFASAPARSSDAGFTLAPAVSDASSTGSFEFVFFDRVDSPAPEIGGSSIMSSADELFLNGQIRPMKLSAHLQRPQPLAPLLDFGGEVERESDDNVEEEHETFRRSRVSIFRDRSQRRRARSLSPLRNTPPFDWLSPFDDGVSKPSGTEEREIGARKEEAETPAGSRSSSAGRSSKRWDFLKDFLRSKSEGRSNNKFWHNISLSSPAKERERKRVSNASTAAAPEKGRVRKGVKESTPVKKAPASGPAKRSAHEMHYAAKRAQAEERRKKTYLPYRQGVLGCLGFNSKSYGALNRFAKSLNPVSSR